MIVIGASGHAKVILNILSLCGVQVTSLYDDDASIQKLNGVNVTSPISSIPIGSSCVFAIGNNTIRKQLVEKHLSFKPQTIKHPESVIDDSVKFGEGTVVMASATINNATSIGNHCIINTSASIDHDCKIDDYVHISPGAVLCGGITVGQGSQVGANSVIVQNKSIGKWATIGAGSVIIKNVPDYAIVVGNPGKIIGYNEK